MFKCGYFIGVHIIISNPCISGRWKVKSGEICKSIVQKEGII